MKELSKTTAGKVSASRTQTRVDEPTGARASAASLGLELLSPAGDWECAHAAVENGADAIYFGLEKFNARMRAQNFTVADLPPLMAYLHQRGVKGYVTFNTLVFDDELAEAETYLKAIIGAGVDAAIVQDAGICRMIRALSPDFPIHASTQMTISNAGGLTMARQLGCRLVALARECSIHEIEQMRQESAAAQKPETPPVDLEVFIHGALCVSYSGQCLTSEALGGRSANRGVCAQACRLPYELIVDGRTLELGDRRYLLSPKDLAGLAELPALIRAGVKVFKIEGRLKSPEYVANMTRIYREAIDQVVDAMGQPQGDSAGEQVASRLQREHQYEMEMAFSRGLYTGWLHGVNNRELVHARFPKKRGVYLGRVIRIYGGNVVVALEGQVKPGDGLVFDAGRPDMKEEGGRVYEVTPRGSETVLGFGMGDLDLARIHPGDRLWKTSDPALEKKWRQSFDQPAHPFQRPVRMHVAGAEGAPMVLKIQDDFGHEVVVQSSRPLERAQKQPLTPERLREQLGRLGGTCYMLGDLDCALQGAVIVPISELNRMRREAVELLDKARSLPLRWTLNAPSGVTAAQRTPSVGDAAAHEPPQLVVLVRTLVQLEAALSCGSKVVYCDFEELRRYPDAVKMVAESCSCQGERPKLFVAPPRIHKPGDEWMLRQVAECGADGILVRNFEHLERFKGQPMVGDYSLNIANHMAADFFVRQCGLARVTPSFDLDGPQLEALLRAAPASWFEVSIHHHMPMFHMEHCVFCAFLSEGTDYTNCGRPCEKHDVQLRDRVGARHPLKADAGCRNTVFHARPQTGARHADRLRAMGVRWFRVEMLDENREQTVKTLANYRALLRGELAPEQLGRELNCLDQLGITKGPE